MTLIKIEKLTDSGLINAVLCISYLSLVLLGTLGNCSIIFYYSSNKKKQTKFISFTLLALIHLLLLYMSFFDFIEINPIVSLLTKFQIACSAFNTTYQIFVFLESW